MGSNLRLRKLTGRVGIDRAIAYTVIFRLIQAFGGVGIVVFIAKYLSKEQQGYYYTFGSLIAIQIFFELGLSSIITQYVAHEMAHLSWEGQYTLQGGAVNHSRVASLLRFCVKWFGIISAMFFTGLMITGFYFFSNFHANNAIDWQGPWIILAFATSGFLFVDPLLAFLEGMAKVQNIARMRMVQQTVYVISVVTFLSLGFKLYSSPLAALLSFLCIVLQLFTSSLYKILLNLWSMRGQWKVHYGKEIFPYQWKIALSWISGYFIFQMFNPVLFATDGPVAAGQMGITLAALNGLMGLSMSWINTKIPFFSGLIAKRDFKQLDQSFFTSLGQSFFVTASGTAVLFTAIFLLQHNNIQIGKRFLSPVPLAFMCLSYLGNSIVFGMATYLRCHKQEPLLVQSVLAAVLTSLSTFVLGYRYGVYGITGGYLALVIIFSIPSVLFVFITKRRLWHQVI